MKYEAGDKIILWRNQANLNEGGVLIQEDNGALAMWLAKDNRINSPRDKHDHK